NIVEVHEFGVQKIHPLAPNLIVGFADSIVDGFTLVDSLRSYVVELGQETPEPRMVAEGWPERVMDGDTSHSQCRMLVGGLSQNLTRTPDGHTATLARALRREI